MDYKAKLLELLGLPADATDQDIEAASAEILTEGDKQEMENRIAALQAELTNRDLDALSITDAAEREAFGAMLNAAPDRAKALAAFKNRLVTTTPAPAARQPLTNRETARTPKNEAIENRSAEQVKLVNELRLANKCSHAEAWALAEQKKPELFREPAPQAA